MKWWEATVLAPAYCTLSPHLRKLPPFPQAPHLLGVSRAPDSCPHAYGLVLLPRVPAMQPTAFGDQPKTLSSDLSVLHTLEGRPFSLSLPLSSSQPPVRASPLSSLSLVCVSFLQACPRSPPDCDDGDMFSQSLWTDSNASISLSCMCGSWCRLKSSHVSTCLIWI